MLKEDRFNIAGGEHVETYLPPDLLLENSSWIDVANVGWNLKCYQIWYQHKALGVKEIDGTYRAATLNELTWKGKWMWAKYVLFTADVGSRKATMARAGWSNLLTCTGISAKPDLINSKDRADAIPQGLDFPYQIIRIGDLGVWCFILGFKYVRVDTVKGDFTARSSLGTIATNHSVAGIGKLVTAEVEFELLRQQTIQATHWEKRHVALNAKGHIRVGGFSARPTSFNLKTIVHGLQQNWTADEWNESDSISRSPEFVRKR